MALTAQQKAENRKDIASGKSPRNASTTLTAQASAAPAGGTGDATGAWDTAGHRDTGIAAVNNNRTRIAELEDAFQDFDLLA